MKRIKNIGIIMILLVSLIIEGKNVSTNSFRINKGKVELVAHDFGSIDSSELKRLNSIASEITGSGEYRIRDKGGRTLVVDLKKGVIDGKYSEYYTNGQIFLMGKYTNGEREGEWRTYLENGKLWKIHTYKNDKLNGKYINYYTRTGIEETIGNYRNGEKDGLWESYYETGKKRLSERYSNGLKSGTSTEWYSSGQKKSSINYLNDVVKGEMKVYYENGSIFYEGDMNDRDGTVKGYYKNGKLSFEGRMRDGRKIGTWSYYDQSGNLYTKMNH